MPSILLIDDREDQRGTVATALRRGLARAATAWDVIEADPYPELGNYVAEITENEVVALVLDERLHESAPRDGQPVSYNGHDLFDFIRGRFPTLPIYVVTSYEDDSELREKFSQVEDILNRASFVENVDAYVTRIVRSAGRFLADHEAMLARLSVLAERFASDVLTSEEESEMRSLQTALGMAFPVEIPERRDALNLMRERADSLEELEIELREYLERDEA